MRYVKYPQPEAKNKMLKHIALEDDDEKWRNK